MIILSLKTLDGQFTSKEETVRLARLNQDTRTLLKAAEISLVLGEDSLLKLQYLLNANLIAGDSNEENGQTS